ncbi:MAG: S8/S53 family peptidase [Lachnospiraceae bacterium]|nr:S8/S53 family peptidase [Lachnospiraceae bacterium]
MRNRRKHRKAGVVVLLTLFLLCSLNVRAEEGYWYFDEFGVQDAHEAGLDGNGIRIADVDTIINTEVPWLSDANIVLRDKAITTYYGDVPPTSTDFMIAFHATDMIALLQGNGEGADSGSAPKGVVPGATIYHYAAVTSEDDSLTGGDVYEVAVEYALEDSVDIISIPAGGMSEYSRQYPVILGAIRQGIPVIVAHSNDRTSVDWYAKQRAYTDEDDNRLEFHDILSADDDDEICYWYGMVTVQAIGEDYNLQVSSRTEDAGTDIAAPGEHIWMEFNDWGDFEAHGGGCSAATTVTSGFLALAMQQWPDATGNQILQLMVRTATFPEDNAYQSVEVGTDAASVMDLTRDPYLGFGVINLEAMLATDPTQFPDVNPILYKDIALAVRNADASERPEALTDPALIEVAHLLDEQLTNAGEERPAFLERVLEGDAAQQTDPAGDPAVAEAPEGDTAAATADTAEELPTVSAEDDREEGDDPAAAAAPGALDADAQEEESAGGSLSDYMPFFIAGIVIVVSAILLIVLKPQKKERT